MLKGWIYTQAAHERPVAPRGCATLSSCRWSPASGHGVKPHPDNMKAARFPHGRARSPEESVSSFVPWAPENHPPQTSALALVSCDVLVTRTIYEQLRHAGQAGRLVDDNAQPSTASVSVTHYEVSPISGPRPLHTLNSHDSTHDHPFASWGGSRRQPMDPARPRPVQHTSAALDVKAS